MKNKKILVILISLLLIIIINLINKKDYYILKIDNKSYKVYEYESDNNYSFKINDKFTFRIFSNFEKSKIVNNIYYYKDDSYECLLPVINNELYTDMLCYKDDIYYDYHTIYGTDSLLDKYVSNIDIYDISKYEDNIKYKTVNSINFNKNIKDITVAITDYKGLVINGNSVNLFNNDIYFNDLGIFLNEYYVIANYNEKYEFNSFYIVNLNTNNITTLESRYDISFNSYIQGVVDNKIYLYDINNEIQYEIDIYNKEITEISGIDTVKYYRNKKWETISKVKANKKVLFDMESLDNNFSKYDYVLENDYFYYLFKKYDNVYKLYRVDKDYIDNYKYLLTIPITNINTNDDYIYYVYENKLYYYSDLIGLKTILEYSELEFNDTIKYYIY